MRRSRRSQAVIPTTEPVARNKGGQRVAHAAKSARAHSRGTTVVHNGMDDLREPSKDAAWRDPSKIAACRGSKIAAWREPSNDAAWRTQQRRRLVNPAKSPLGTTPVITPLGAKPVFISLGDPCVSGAVVGVVVVDAPGAVEGFGDNYAHQWMRQGQFA